MQGTTKLLLDAMDDVIVSSYLKNVSFIEAVRTNLQSESLTVFERRSLFKAVMEMYPLTKDRIYPKASIFAEWSLNEIFRKFEKIKIKKQEN